MIDDRSFARFRLVAIVVGAVQLALAVMLAGRRAEPLLAPVSAQYPGNDVAQLAMVDVQAGALVILAASGVAGVLLVQRRFAARVRESLGVARTSIRWLEFALTSPVLVFLLAQLAGIREVTALVGIYALASGGVLFAALQDRSRATGHARLRPFVYGCMVGIVPWGLVALSVIAPGATSPSDQPLWVMVAILGSLALHFAVAAILWLDATGRASSRIAVEYATLAASAVATIGFALLTTVTG